MDLSECCERLDDRLDVPDYAPVDASANGLQVGPRSKPVEHVALAVDAVAATIEAAGEADADLLLTHHGIVWGGLDRVTTRNYDLVSGLMERDLALYAVHLPLDGHQELGNAAGVADVLGLDDREPFGDYDGETIGTRGRLSEPTPAATLRDRLADELDTGDGTVRHLDHGAGPVEDVAVVTGGGADWLDEAIDAGVDCFVTGEGKHKVYHMAREAGIDVVLGGHYATETFGVRRLGDLLEEWGLETTFVSHPTGL